MRVWTARGLSGKRLRTVRRHKNIFHAMGILLGATRASRDIDKRQEPTPFVRSITWSGNKKSLGLISSLKLPTALNATTHLTPSFLNAAMLALDGTSCGAISWCRPCLERNATFNGVPEGRGCERMVMGEEVEPQGVQSWGCVRGSLAMGVKCGRWEMPVPPIMAM